MSQHICPFCGGASRTRPKPTVDISIVVPAYNEEASLEALYANVRSILEATGFSWELVFVNDGSRDGTTAVLRLLSERDTRVKGVVFARNFGQQLALTAGMQHSSGRAVIMMDADLQHPPQLIPEMIRLWKEGYHVVYTERTYGREIGSFKRFTSDLYRKTINGLSDVELASGAADFRLLDRAVVDCLNAMPENSRFLRGLVAWSGFRQIGIPYVAAPRFAGTTKYSLFKMLTLASDGITSFSTKPLRWSMYFGFFTAAAIVPYSLLAIYQHLFTNLTVPGWSSLIVAVSFLGGVQLMSLGILGEYVGRIYTEVKQRPLYTVQERYGFAADSTEQDNASLELRRAG